MRNTKGNSKTYWPMPPLSVWINKLDLLTVDLSASIGLDVEIQSPPNLINAMSLARAFGRKQQLERSLGNQKNSWYYTVCHYSIYLQDTFRYKQQVSNSITASSTNSRSTPFIRKLIQAKMANRRSQGLCYNCDEMYSIGHQYKKIVFG